MKENTGCVICMKFGHRVHRDIIVCTNSSYRVWESNWPSGANAARGRQRAGVPAHSQVGIVNILQTGPASTQHTQGKQSADTEGGPKFQNQVCFRDSSL